MPCGLKLVEAIDEDVDPGEDARPTPGPERDLGHERVPVEVCAGSFEKDVGPEQTPVTTTSASLEAKLRECRAEPFGHGHHDVDVVRDEGLVGGPEVDGHPADDDRPDAERRRDLFHHRDDFQRAFCETVDLRCVGERRSEFGELWIRVLAHATNLLRGAAGSAIGLRRRTARIVNGWS